MALRCPVTTTNCRLCGIEFPIKPSRLKRSKLNFCSDSCLRKKNTLHGWIVRCNREFQSRCARKTNPVNHDRWELVLRGFVATDWVRRHENRLTVKSQWDMKLASMHGANRHREKSRELEAVRAERRNIQRDAEIFLLHQSGFTKKEIAKSYAISFGRVDELLKRERFERGMRGPLPIKNMAYSWEKTLGKLRRKPREVDAWTVKLMEMQSNHRKRMKKKAALQCHRSGNYSHHKHTNVHCPAMT